MTKIVLHHHHQSIRYHALIGDHGKGWVYLITKYMENGKEVLEAMVDNRDEHRTAAYRFSFDGSNWVTNSDPITSEEDRRTRLWDLI